MGYDAPELRSKDEEEKKKAAVAKDFLRQLLPGGVFTVHVKGLDKYGRLLIDPVKNGRKVSEIMIANHHGYAYNGGTKQPFVVGQ